MADVTRDEFREGLFETLLIAKRLAPHCQSIDEMVGLIELAIGADGDSRGNEAQLRILMGLVFPSDPVAVKRRA